MVRCTTMIPAPLSYSPCCEYSIFSRRNRVEMNIQKYSKEEQTMSVKRIEDVIGERFTGDIRKNATDFVEHLELDESQMAFDEGGFCWSPEYKGKPLFHIKMSGFNNEPGSWIIWSADDYNGDCADSTDEKIKEFAWANISPCGNCGGCKNPGRSVVVFGKQFDKVCHSALIFVNPDAEAIESLKKLADIRKSNILNDV